MLRLCGAELVEVPAVPYANPNNYQHVGRRLADELRKTEKNGVLFANQWNNLDNRKAHYVSTGPEIWEQTDGKVDGFICSVGTGGTLAGTSLFLKREEQEHRDRLRRSARRRACITCSRTASSKVTEGGSITEGIGLGRITPIIEGIQVDLAYQIPDEEAVPIDLRSAVHEGLCLGGSSGINIAGAIRLAKELGPGKTIVTCCATSAPATSRSCSIRTSALEEPAGAGLAGEAHQARRAVREDVKPAVIETPTMHPRSSTALDYVAHMHSC